MRSSGSRIAFVALMGIALACGREGPQQPEEVAFVRLTCLPVSRGVRCQLVALFRDVRRSPQDVTALATWQLVGEAVDARISRGGVIEATQDGDVKIDAHYLSHSAHAVVRLARDRPGQMLATVRGRVYVEVDRGALRPVAHARVEIVSGPSAGTAATADKDGNYELMAVVPGDLLIRVTKVGYTAADRWAHTEPGDNPQSLLMQMVDPSAASAL
jgi:hypothetical protein